MKSKMRSTFVSMVLSGVMMATLAAPVKPVEAAAINGWEVTPLANISEAGKTPEQVLVESLLGGGVTVSNVEYKGSGQSAGTFKTTNDVIGFQDGIILSSGKVQNVIGPNVQDAMTDVNNLPGDSDLNSLIPGYPTFDATVLEFDFIPDKENISFQYVFGSDEYNEYTHSSYNDVFGFYLNGTNVAKLDNSNTIVSINSINGGEPFGTNANNPLYFRNNDPSDGSPKINTEMDGLTVVLSVYAPVKAQQVNHIKLAIADAGDRSLDSNVFIKAKSITDKENTPPVATADSSSTNEGVPVSVDVLVNDFDADGDQLMVTNVSGAVNGTTTIGPNGSAVIYTPNAGFSGTDSFTYTISDGKGATASALVTVNTGATKKQSGSMKGGGSFTSENDQQVNFNYEMYSLDVPAPYTMEIKWSDQVFKLSKLNTLDLIKSGSGTGTNNYAKGTGTGAINGVGGATIEFLFTDTNVKGNDFAQILVKDVNGDIVLSTSGTVTTGDNSAYFWSF